MVHLALALQEAAGAAAEQHAARGAHPMDGTLAEFAWALPLLPLLGFAVNGLLGSLKPAFHKGPVDPYTTHDHSGSHAAHGAHAAHTSAHEQDHGDHGDDHHAVKRHPFAGVASIVGPAVLGVAFALALGIWLAMIRAGGGEMHAPFIREYFTWMTAGDLHIGARFQLDQLSMLMTLVITGVGFLIHVFSVGYMQDDPGYPRYFAYLNLFVFFMLVLVLGGNYPMLFVGWEGVGLCSYLLIGFWFSEEANANAGKKAFIVNRIGDVGLMVAMFLLFANLGSLDYTVVSARAGELAGTSTALVTAICLFMFLGCAGKSAQLPLYVWLPDAMAGPTPVSALIHAATMVTAGVYLIARSAALFALSPVACLVVALVGALTALFAATIGLKQWDIKKVLAYSTVSQLGYMFIGVGVGAYAAGVFHLVTHAFFKALLFLGSGSVIFAMHRAYHATHSHEDAQDMRNMGGLKQYMKATWVLMWIATLAIAGIPVFSGFFSKDEILSSVFARAQDSTIADLDILGVPASLILYIIYAIGLGAALLTAIYMTRMMMYTFHGHNRTGEEERKHLAEAPVVMTAPLAVLGALSLFGGWLNLPAVVPIGPIGVLHHWLEPVVGGPALAITHGAEAEIAHSTEFVLIGAAVAIALGGVLFAWAKFGRAILQPKRLAPEPEGFERVLEHKYYVDEIYDRAVVRPIVGPLSTGLLWHGIDKGLIDGLLVNGPARLAKALGRLGSWVQGGVIGRYAWVLVLGVVVVLGMFTKQFWWPR